MTAAPVAVSPSSASGVDVVCVRCMGTAVACLPARDADLGDTVPAPAASTGLDGDIPRYVCCCRWRWKAISSDEAGGGVAHAQRLLGVGRAQWCSTVTLVFVVSGYMYVSPTAPSVEEEGTSVCPGTGDACGDCAPPGPGDGWRSTSGCGESVGGGC